MTVTGIKTVCFIGAGTMGCFNSLKAAISGYDVVLYDINQDTLQAVGQRQRELAEFLVASGYCAAEDIPAALARVSPVADLGQATANADLVSESVFERLDIKREIHRQLDRVCPPGTILTTNSSYLLVSEIEDVVRRGERFAALHSYMASPLVDIVGGPRTSAATIDLLERYVCSIDAVPLVLKKEHPGYVLNAVLGPVMTTALYLVIAGEASCDDVDRAWMSRGSAPMGPLGILDLIGLDLIYDSWQHREDEGSIPGLRPQVLAFLQPFMDSGELGMKSGKGFYRYPAPAYQDAGFLDVAPGLDALYKPLLMAWLGSAVVVAANGIADPADIDRAWMVGTSLDTGPFAILEQMGTAEFLALFARHSAAGLFDPDNARIVVEYLQCGTRGDP